MLGALVLVAATASAGQQSPSIRVVPSCTASRPVELSLTISGRGFLPDDTVAVIFDSGRANQTLGTVGTANDGSFDVTAGVTAKNEPDPGIPGYGIDAIARRGEDRESTILRVPCPSQPPPTTSTTVPPGSTTTTTTVPSPAPPTLRMDPPMGPPGFVSTATGSGWPPGAVTIGWDAGGDPITAVADAAGGFSVPVLVLPGTTLGVQGLQGAGAGWVSASGTFLVVPHSAGPPLWNH
jgi:hypothetical protein